MNSLSHSYYNCKLASVVEGVSPGNYMYRDISRRTGGLDMLLRTLGTILSARLTESVMKENAELSSLACAAAPCTN